MTTSPVTVTRRGTVVPSGEIARYSFQERLCHWLNGFAYVYCLLTGLGFYSPYLYWLVALTGGGPTARFLHPWLGLLFFCTTVWMHFLWETEMRAIPEDKEWNRNIKHYVQNEDELVPPQGKFNAGQKTFFWVMFYSAIALLLTGLVMWFPEMMPRSLHWVLTVMIPLHVIAALVTIAGFIIHVYMGVFMVSGGLKAIVHGYVSRAWAQHHHRLWYEKVKKEN